MQTGSNLRGIGRYTRSFVKALLRNKGDNEIYLLLNGGFPDTITSIIKEFSSLIDLSCIKIWNANIQTEYVNPKNLWRRQAASFIRMECIRQIKPDIVLLTTLFEGFGDNFMATVESTQDGGVPVACIAYDLIPLLNSKYYLGDSKLLEWYGIQIEILKKCKLLFAISESTKKEIIENLDFPSKDIINISSAVEDEFSPIKLTTNELLSFKKKFGIDKDYLMYSGATDPRKNHIRLIQAYAKLSVDIRKKHQLVIVGGMPVEHKKSFEKEINGCGLKPSECIFTDRVDDETLIKLYSNSKGYVFPSWHEGFGLPVLEAVRCGSPVIASNTSSLPEVVGDDSALFDPFSIDDISAKMTRLLSDVNFREGLVKTQFEHCKKFCWDTTAKDALLGILNLLKRNGSDNITKPIKENQFNYSKLGSDLGVYSSDISESDLFQLANSLAANENIMKRELLIDISELIKQDAHTGIQRVTRALIKSLTKLVSDKIVVRTVCATEKNVGYYYAENIIEGSYAPEAFQVTTRVRAAPGDIFLGLDLIHPEIAIVQATELQKFRDSGLLTFFIIYDLIPVLYPQFVNIDPQSFTKWLEIVADANGIICISKDVASDFYDWVSINKTTCLDSIQISNFNLGADIKNSVPSLGLLQATDDIQDSMKKCPTFLMVGTLEPRKGHLQVLNTFKEMWAKGFDVNLVIVGKPGWSVDNLIRGIEESIEFGKRLFLLKNVSDEYLEILYKKSTALIAASYKEGYGLPLIEAARHKLPILARDIAVFREVAGDHAYYFKAEQSKEFAEALQSWLSLFKQNLHPKSENMPFITWNESARQLMRIILSGDSKKL